MTNISVPLPQSRAVARSARPPMKLFQARVSEKVYQACKAEWKKRGLTSRQVLAWALQSFLISANLAAAKKAGIDTLVADSL